MKKVIYGLFALSGMVMTVLGINATKAQASVTTPEIVPVENVTQSNTAIDFAGMMNAKDNVLLGYHYSHRSHVSHGSHRSHYSSRF